MKTTQEQPEEHAKIYSPSAAERWMNCPASVQHNLAPQPSSPYAEEGTTAHELAAICLEHDYDGDTIPSNLDFDRYPQEMRDYIQIYLDFVRQTKKEMENNNG